MVARRITSPQHPLVKKAVRLRQDKALRHQEKRVVVPGFKLAQELAPVEIFISADPSLSVDAQEVILTTPEIVEKIVGISQEVPVASLVALPTESKLDSQSSILILEGIADPGNVGTLIRSALAFSWDLVVLLEGTCDPFNDKAIRASKGAVFRQPLLTSSWDLLLPWMKENKTSILVADMKGLSLDQMKVTLPIALVLGNEAKGVSPSARNFGKPITIPMSLKIESLNVSAAGAILMYTLKRFT